jgi:hypothetical protein
METMSVQHRTGKQSRTAVGRRVALPVSSALYFRCNLAGRFPSLPGSDANRTGPPG